MREERERGGNPGQGRSRIALSIAKDLRIWNREEYVRMERDLFSVFVDSLPAYISKWELFGLFSWTGRINDIYLSRKTRNGMIYLFAFIRYTTKGGALKAIVEMNHMQLRGKELFVGEAKYGGMLLRTKSDRCGGGRGKATAPPSRGH
ncbi:polyadenylate-binding protein, cytoplasmic and nuclear-like [Arachis stenosperma]|uniref:polyadenylate-binding protein, cytoplasmic and nuclear-like n=1 Tax=Arachis stenosperma TaxID=217475 RepID=UPI0025AC993B|nr:polyadenylate-binding protein, cytoplasmic and nuclear-like [Arachis stenosperma]